MSKRSIWCEFDKDTRKYIKKRDKEQCVVCHRKGALQIMHIFLSRAHGGHGCKENGCLGCITCHRIIDNPIGKEEQKLSQEKMEIAKNYLINAEHLKVDKEFIDSLHYHKQIQRYSNVVVNTHKDFKRCDDCKYCIKITNAKNSIPTYMCQRLNKQISHKGSVCSYFNQKIDKY